ncbi:TonB-dependent receptor plug domain-containing protein [Flavobacterium ustbae]|uniref:TonB-dependent receptor plug domain-containing protein n=1 Tax=Flavobacterium ustbae TaxID=2488790 RepID=UPI000F7B3FA1|nr:TonB-dependent receptor plug domain-containing protein [Flavobacterium ustbae]
MLSLHGQSENHSKKNASSSSDTLKLKTATIISKSITQKVNQQAFNVTAVDAKKLHNSSLDISSVLDRVSGARLRQTGGVGSGFDLSINGFSGKRIRFFLDGVPMDNFGSSFQINNIPVNFAERIEIYKGVVPVWLGSDALGGAVNIVTGSRLKNYLDFSYSYGSFNTHRTNLNTAFTTKKGFTVQLNAFQNYSDNNFKVTVDAADVHTGKYYPNTVVKRFHDQYHNETAILKIGLLDKKWADQLLFGITLGQYYKEIQTGAQLRTVFGAWHTKGDILMPSLKYLKKDFLAKDLDVIINANYNLGKEQSIDTVHARYGWLGDSIQYKGKGGELWYAHNVFKNNAANASATVSYKINDKHSLALNNVYSHFNRKTENLVAFDQKPYNIPQRTDKNIAGLSYQYLISEKWNATVFAKNLNQKANTTLIETTILNPLDTIYRNVSSNINKMGYGLATSYQIKPELQIKFSYEKTNRLPESEDLFGDFVNKEGNWNIKPETSDNFNVGFNYTLPINNHNFYVSGAAVYYYAKDFIYYTFNNVENKLVAGNLMDVSNTGLEAEARYSYGQFFTMGLNASYQDIRDKQRYRADLPASFQIKSETYGERIPNIPYLFGNADASLFFKNVLKTNDKFSIGYNLLYVHDFYLYWESQGDAKTKYMVPEQLSHDLNLLYTLKNGRFNIGLECRNFTDNKLYDNFSLQKPGRAFFLKLRYFINKS